MTRLSGNRANGLAGPIHPATTTSQPFHQLSKITQNAPHLWRAQRLHGLCLAFRQECEANELKYVESRLKTIGGIKKLKQILMAAIPAEYRTNI